MLCNKKLFLYSFNRLFRIRNKRVILIYVITLHNDSNAYLKLY